MAQRHKAVVDTGKTSIQCSSMARASKVPTKVRPRTSVAGVPASFACSTITANTPLAAITQKGNSKFIARRRKKLSR